MRSFWKIAVPVACVAVICGAAITWQVYKAKATAQRLAEDAEAFHVRAEQGDAKAQFKLGQMYYQGKGAPQDYTQALRWYRKAADQGDAKAQYDLGYMFSQGQGVTQDYAEALRWYGKAADQGEARAQDALAGRYYYGQGAPQDYTEAVHWYRKAAEQGDARGQDGLGSAFYQGKGVPQDYAEAVRWYGRAAGQGYARGQYNLGYMYSHGKGVPQDHAEAARWYRKAAKQGDKFAQRALDGMEIGPTTWTKIYLSLALLGGMWLLTRPLLPGRRVRDRQWRAKALTGLLLLSWVGVSLYGFSRIGIVRSGWVVNAFYIAKDLLGAICVTALIFLPWPQSGESRNVSMNGLRKSLSWLFAVSSLICLWLALSDAPRILHRHNAVLSFRYALVPLLFSTMAAVFGMAWFTVWRGKPSGKWWGVVASLIDILLPLCLSIYLRTSILSHFVVLLGMGVAGLVAFSSHHEQPAPAAIAHKNPGIPGDGTNGHMNSIAAFVNAALGLAAFFWWIRWVSAKDVSTSHGDLYFFILIAASALALTVLHELAHTVTGLALGMKLRAFVAGPFQWRMRGGKWEFHFKPQAVLAVEGATGVVPASADFARWRELSMVAAGPVVNLLSGMLALWIAFTEKANSPLQAGGLVALFGAWSLAIGVGNLLPMRAGENYSDGAHIYQLLSDGPWAEYHRVIGLVTSSLVTPLRPRDFDIDAIRRTAHSFTQGKQGLLLRLFAYTYFFDSGKLREAEEALREAESIYHQSASDIPAELLTVFVFGDAYLRRDAVAAREWWTRMDAKKPTRFNSDYWRAYSALQWAEGNLKEANDAWEKSNALAQQLPQAGEYEFDRYCCSKLRQGLDESPRGQMGG